MNRRQAQEWTPAERLDLAEHLLFVARKGDLEYLANPVTRQFAVLNLADQTKAIYELPRDSSTQTVRTLIEHAYGAYAERIGERLWAL